MVVCTICWRHMNLLVLDEVFTCAIDATQPMKDSCRLIYLDDRLYLLCLTSS